MTAALQQAVEGAALDLPGPVVAALADVLDGCDAWSGRAQNRMGDVSPAGNVQSHVTALCAAWNQVGDLPGPAVALALRAAHAAADRIRSAQQVEIAWTGPAVGAVDTRATLQVLIETIRSARRSLLCLSFAAFRDEHILAELAAAAGRGVEVNLILEDATESKGALSVDAREAFASLGSKVGFYVWPTELRPAVGRGLARFHAKALVADHHVAFVTSANLTGAAMNDNIELGLVVTGGPIPQNLERHLRELIDAGILRPVA